MAVELNLAQVIGYSVQVLLILALLIALSIRSWPFLIAIVFVALLALVLACMRSANSTASKVVNGNDDDDEEECTLTANHVMDPNSLDSIRLSRETPDPAKDAAPVWRSGRYDFNYARHQEETQRHQFTRTFLHASTNSGRRENMPPMYGAAGSYPQNGYQYSPPVQSYQPPHRPYPQEYQPYQPPQQSPHQPFEAANQAAAPRQRGYPIVSPYTQASLAAGPAQLANIERQIRWNAQSAPHMHGSVPLVSQNYFLAHMNRQDVYRPDPNLVPVNPGARRRGLDALKPKLSSWATGSYLHRK